VLFRLIWFYPNYETYLRDSLTALVGKEIQEKVEITALDGAAAGGMSRHVLSELEGLAF